jgi:CRP-like cAMP-binding protein
VKGGPTAIPIQSSTSVGVVAASCRTLKIFRQRENPIMSELSFQPRKAKPAPHPSAPPANLLLASMPDFELLAPFLERVTFDQEGLIYDMGGRITHYLFPLRGVSSIVKEMREGTVEVGTVGPEGLIGIPALLGVRTTASRIFAQTPLVADRIDVDHLDGIIETSDSTRAILWAYVHAFHEEVSQSVACNRMHTLEERLARWLLMTHDRLETETMPLKQKFLSYMLGVHRPAVSLAAGALQKAGIIRYTRGMITILDRSALEDAACECYALGLAAYQHARLAHLND